MSAKSTRTTGQNADARTAEILRSLRDARKVAVKIARMHGVPIVYRKAGKLVREKP